MKEKKAIRVTKEECEEVINRQFLKSEMVIIIDGKRCKTLFDYYDFIYKRLNFPTWGKYITFDGYSDWMRDGMYFPNDVINFIIVNFNQFLCEADKDDRRIIMEIFEEDMQEYWTEEAETCDRCQKSKELNVYVMDDDVYSIKGCYDYNKK